MILSGDGKGGDLGYPQHSRAGRWVAAHGPYESMQQPKRAVLRQAKWALADSGAQPIGAIHMTMEYRQLGGSGLKVPVLSLGTGTFGGGGELFKAWGDTDVAEATRLVDICLEAGLTMFDSADVYSAGMAEEILGAGDQGPPRPGAHLDQGHVPHRPRPERRRLVAISI